MRKKNVKISVTVVAMLVLLVQLFSLTVVAEDNMNGNVVIMTEERSLSQQAELEEIYQQLFPDEFHFIQEYQQNGVLDIAAEDIETLFVGSKVMQDKTYDLIVMSNGQIFTNISDNIPDSKARGRMTGDFTVGDIGHYTTFTITYTINYSGYDTINSCDNITGSGFYLYPTNLSRKWTEDANGPAHYGYNNVSMNYDGSGVLYDIGVAVGNNKAKGITQLSSGVDKWVWAFLYAFFF